jgi:hypothetical protein
MMLDPANGIIDQIASLQRQSRLREAEERRQGRSAHRLRLRWPRRRRRPKLPPAPLVRPRLHIRYP